MMENNKSPDLGEVFSTWLKIGVLSFGGPAAQIALMHKVIVEEKKWLEEKQFLNALNFCMLLPGPEAMQLATYSGWRISGVIGGLVAGLLFVLPGAAVILLLAALYANYGDIPLTAALFTGIKAAVLVIVIEALIKVSKRALLGISAYTIAVLAFIGLFFMQLPYPLIILAAALYGYFNLKSSVPVEIPSRSGPLKLASFGRTTLLWLMIWWLPILGLWLISADTILTDLAIFFSQLAVVTFGGAYAVLAYMSQDVVNANNWLEAAEMIDGLGLAETTPGPLILVTEFVGFIAAEKIGGFWLGVAGAGVVLWVTFVPCFLWIFAFAPYIEAISKYARLQSALSAITAAVVGVIFNLSLWFGLQVVFKETHSQTFGPINVLKPDLSTLDPIVLAIGLLSAFLLFYLKWSVLAVIGVAALAGFATYFV